jgi:hypothetical protein
MKLLLAHDRAGRTVNKFLGFPASLPGLVLAKGFGV